jgi:CRISP-associated protein Cas1
MPIIQHLIADQFGTHIGKYSGRLKITQGKETVAQAPIIHLQSVTIANSGVSISAEAIRACTEQGIPIHFLSGTGTPYASLYSAGLTGTILTRRAQLTAYRDARALRFAASTAEAKLTNSATLLKYIAKYRKESDPETYAELHRLAQDILGHLSELDQWLMLGIREASLLEEVRFELLSIEGRAAQRYWAGIGLALTDKITWLGRVTRGATDPFNSALNYGYGVLYGQIEQAITLAGLDPYAGFVHADRPGKPSLVFDLIEEFRAPVVDRTVLGLVNKGVSLGQDEQGFLTQETRQLLAEKVLARLDTAVPYHEQRHTLRHIIQAQARTLATYLRGDRDEYLPYLLKL